MRFRKVRIAWSVFCGVGAVLLIVLWVRSYWWIDIVDVADWYETVSLPGEITIFKYDATISIGDPWSYTGIAINDIPGGCRVTDTILGFKRPESPVGRGIMVPHWFPFILLAFLGAAPCLPWRFSLRTLLLATTLVAVVLGAIVYVTR